MLAGPYLNQETPGMSDENENAEPTAEAPEGIEAEAAAAAAEAPAEPEAAPAADPAPEPEAAKPAAKAKGKAKPTARKRQTASKGGKDTAQQGAHRAAVKANRPEPTPAAEPTEAQLAEVDAKKANRERLREIKELIAVLDADRVALVDEQQVLATFGAHGAADNRPHHVRHQEVLARSKELREQRKNDRLKLLAASAGKSPLDLAMGAGPRKSLAAADATAAEDE